MTSDFQFNLVPGNNDIDLRVTAPDGITRQDYDIKVVRRAAVASCSVAAMANPIWTGNLTAGQIAATAFGFLGFSGDLDDTTFNYGGTSYTISRVTSGAIFGPAEFGFALNGNFGTAAADLVLHVGNTQYRLGDATLTGNTYKWTSNLPSWANGTAACLALTEEVASTDATLSALALSGVTLSPAFDADTETYTASVANSVATTTVTAMATDAGATVAVTPSTDADAVTSGHQVNLGVGPTTITATVTAEDGMTTKTYTVVVTRAANASPAFSAATATRSVPENSPASTHVGAPVTATDGDNDPLAYSLEGTAATAFEIVSTSGQIRTTAGETYDRETQSSYAVTVKADDGNGGTDTIAVTITLTNVIEPPGRPAAPSVSSVADSTTSLSVMWTAPENTGPAIDTYDLRYRQGTSGSWINGPQNVSGTSATISGLTANTLYQVQVLATSGEGGSPWSPSGSGQTNTAGNTAPTFSSPTASRSVPENSAAGTNVGAPVTATDADSGDTLTYTLDGTDAASFDIVSTSGQIQTRSGVTYDYETKSSYAVIVKAADGNGGSDTIMVTITVTDVDESPSPEPGPEPGPEPVPTPALPLLGHLLLALGLTAAGARVIRRRSRVPPAA